MVMLTLGMNSVVHHAQAAPDEFRDVGDAWPSGCPAARREMPMALPPGMEAGGTEPTASLVTLLQVACFAFIAFPT